MDKLNSRTPLLPCLAATALFASPALADVVDFDNLDTGAILSSVDSMGGAGPILVEGFNPALGALNAAVVFDSSNPSGMDDDLGSPNADFGGPGIGVGGQTGAFGENTVALGKILIVDQRGVAGPGGLVPDPDDGGVPGSTLEFDFGQVGELTMRNMTYIDIEVPEASNVEFFDGNGSSLGVFTLPAVGDNGVHTLDFGGVGGVMRMVVTFGGSGGISGFEFDTGPFIFCDSNPNSTGQVATIDTNGSLSIGDNNFDLVIDNLPANKPAYVIYGTTQGNVPFNDGVRCIVGQLFRYTKVPSTGPTGTVVVPLDFNQPPLSSGPGQVVPGTAYYFQAWFRDPAGPSGSNTTDGLCVTFNP